MWRLGSAAIAASLTILCAFPAPANETAGLEVRINNLKAADGKVVIALFDSEESYLKKPVDEQSVKISDDLEAVARFSSLKPGHYAVAVYHDKNSNGDLDTRFGMIPKEPYGFSNDARGTFGPAKFSKAAFEVSSQDLNIDVRIK